MSGDIKQDSLWSLLTYDSRLSYGYIFQSLVALIEDCWGDSGSICKKLTCPCLGLAWLSFLVVSLCLSAAH